MAEAEQEVDKDERDSPRVKEEGYGEGVGGRT